MGKKLVTVLMPCYNHEKYLADSIESVLNQTYKDFNFIVADNGSTDHSYEVIKRYKDKIDVIIRCPENNVRTVWRPILEKVKTEYIALMTSDDIWHPEKLEKQMQLLAENPQLGVCFTFAEYVNDNLQPIETLDKDVFLQENRTRHEWIHYFMLNGNCLAFPTAVIKTDIWKSIHNDRDPYLQLGDYVIWLNLVKKYNIYILPEILLRFRRNENTLSSPKAETSMRTINEEIMLMGEFYTKLSNDDFIHAFKEELYDKNVNPENELEVLCEKILVFFRLKEMKELLATAAIGFFYQNFRKDGVEEVMLKKYGFTFIDLQKNCKNGCGQYYYNQNQLVWYVKTLEQLVHKYTEMVNDLPYSKLDDEFCKTCNMMIEYLENRTYMQIKDDEREKNVGDLIGVLYDIDRILCSVGITINIREKKDLRSMYLYDFEKLMSIFDMAKEKLQYIMKLVDLRNCKQII